MKDHLGIFGQQDSESTGELNVDELRAALKEKSQEPLPPQAVRGTATRERRARRIADQKRRRRRRRNSMIAVGVLVVIAAATLLMVRIWSTEKPVPPADFAGAGAIEKIIQISDGDGRSDIAATLLKEGVIASTAAFIDAGANVVELNAIQPGYYKVLEGASAASTITALLDPASKVGQVDLIPGVTLGDVTTGDGTVAPGYISQLTDAACVPVNDVSNCFTTDQLWNALRTTSLADLGLVDWAVAPVSANPDLDRRLEGMIVPGLYNVPPGDDPVAVLRTVISDSAVYWTSTEIGSEADVLGQSEYQLAIIGSLVQKEAIVSDMKSVAGVVYNRLALPMDLQLDSTVSYGVGESKITTTDAQRNDPANLYSTYAHPGLPPNPIGGIGPDALDAALHPATVQWYYFVVVDLAGKSCFSTTYDEHQLCVAKAQAAGVFD